ncbi:MAG TPA: MlaD family protein, partial [Burkholderiales bacterium]|nr:MlaD family protein [Burkholderiales bacterium]
MADAPRDVELPDIPEAVAVPKSRWSIQLVWLIPLVAALIGGWLAVKAVLERGPMITISFKTAEGLEAGKTKIKYKEVEIGVVKSVTLSEDRTRVIATAEIVKEAENLLVEDIRFWVVRARISGGSVSGLGTLLAGSYIGVDIGKSVKPQRNFVGLEVQPLFATDVPGRQFV